MFKKKRKEKKCCTTHDDLSFLTGLVRLSFWHDWPHIYCTAIEIHVRSPLTVDLVVCLVSDTHVVQSVFEPVWPVIICKLRGRELIIVIVGCFHQD